MLSQNWDSSEIPIKISRWLEFHLVSCHYLLSRDLNNVPLKESLIQYCCWFNRHWHQLCHMAVCTLNRLLTLFSLEWLVQSVHVLGEIRDMILFLYYTVYSIKQKNDTKNYLFSSAPENVLILSSVTAWLLRCLGNSFAHISAWLMKISWAILRFIF